MNNEKIIELSLDLDVNETSKNQLCPFCNGGTSKEKSFSITRRSNGVLYNCYRATCGSSGFIGSDKVVYTTGRNKREKKEKEPDTYNHELTPSWVTYAEPGWMYFWRQFELSRRECKDNQIYYNSAWSTYAFPLFDYRGFQFGILDRSYSGRKPKAISYWFSHNVPKVHFPKQWHSSGGLLVVEDIVSSIKASRYMNSCAILGTAFTEEIAQHLSSISPHIILALDNDAIKKAINFRRKYGILFKKFEILLLEKDIKDTSHIELEKIFRRFL